MLARNPRYERVFDWQNMAGAAVPADLTALLGTFALSGGLSAATLAADGYELVVNGNMETGDPPTGWTAETSAVLDGVADERTGGVGAQSLSIVNGVNANSGRASQILTLIPYASHVFSVWRRNISTNPLMYVYTTPGLVLLTSVTSAVTAWEGAIKTAVATQAAYLLWLRTTSIIAGQESRFDDVSVQATIAQLLLPAPLLNASHVCAVAWPAAPDVTPFALYLRGSDALNYWEARLTPNTAGTDCQIIQHVAGVQTVRASADVDWTPAATDMVKVIALGSTISVYHQKSGVTGWTAACSYGSATPAAAANKWGWLCYKAAQTYAKLSIVEALE